jgi:GNAT superfamily N-acetyltransferase
MTPGSTTERVRIRPGRADEHQTLRDLEVVAATRFAPWGFSEGVIADTTPVEELEAAQRAGRVFVAELDGRIVGFAFVEPAAVDGNAHLAELDVHPDHGRQGIGRMLVRHVADWTRGEGYPALTLTTFRDVPFNRPFYERLGFRVVDGSALGPELEEIVRREDATGLARAERVAMRLDLGGRRRRAPATVRNRDPICAVLRRVLPATGIVLEIASGTGEHAVHVAAALPSLAWQPTDNDPAALAAIATTIDGMPNVHPPRFLDVAVQPWPLEHAAAVVCINLIHIAPWAACEALCHGAARVLAPGGPLYLYGPYRVGGRHTAPSNEAFDAGLRARNAAWGVRDLEAVVETAARAGFDLAERVAMPANNQSVIFRRRDG